MTKLNYSIKYSYFLIFTICVNLFLTQLMSLSPIYFAFVAALALLFLCNSFDPNMRLFIFDKDDYPIIGVMLVLCSNIILTTVVNNGALRTFISIIFTDFCFLFSFNINAVPKETIRKSFYILKYITLALFVIEVIYRFQNSEAKHSFFYFYDYKHNSIMFPDTNATAVCIEFFLCFLFYLKERRIIKIYFIEILITIVLLILAFSRAAGFGVFCLLTCWYFIKCRIPLIKILMIIFAISIGIYILIYFFSDASFLTKIDLFVQTVDYINKIDFFHFFIGNGIDSCMHFLSRYGHTFVTLYIIELGTLSLLVLFVLFLIAVLKTKYALFMVIPFVTTGLSYMPYVIPFFFLYLGFIYNIECHRNDLFYGYEIRRRKRHGKMLRLCFAYRR